MQHDGSGIIVQLESRVAKSTTPTNLTLGGTASVLTADLMSERYSVWSTARTATRVENTQGDCSLGADPFLTRVLGRFPQTIKPDEPQQHSTPNRDEIAAKCLPLW